MMTRHILKIILCGIILSSSAQTIPIKEAHKQAHLLQLANANSKIDKSVIQDFLKTDIEKREELSWNEGSLSKENEIMINDLLTEAKSHLGKRYRSGGKGPNVFDCSGFSSYVYNQFGFNLGASSRDQFLQGEKIEIKDLRPGDLVFFSGRRHGKGVGHVGIVVSVDNEKSKFNFIHASSTQGIKIDSNIGYYEGRYLGARRIIND